MVYPESIRSRMFDWYDGPPQMNNRVKPMVKDVTPCSEYTRYTVEGIFKDPRSELSAVLDIEALGPIFMNSDLIDPKWSPRLGYGMALVGEDTRVHLHRNGKYVIRRALDRGHAESTYQIIVNLIRPTLYDTVEKRYLWDLTRSVLDGGTDEGKIAPFLKWPEEEEEGDIRNKLERIREGAREVDINLLRSIRNALLRGKEDELASIKIRVDEMAISYTGELLNDIDVTLGRLSALVWARNAFALMEGPPKPDLEGITKWDELVDHLSEMEEGGHQIMIARLHYLLSPVN